MSTVLRRIQVLNALPAISDGSKCQIFPGENAPGPPQQCDHASDFGSVKRRLQMDYNPIVSPFHVLNLLRMGWIWEKYHHYSPTSQV